MDGDEVLQLYIRHINTSGTEPLKQLKNFKRVTVAKGKSKRVSLFLGETDMRYWDEKTNRWVIYPGDYEVMIGGSSEDNKLTYRVSIK